MLPILTPSDEIPCPEDESKVCRVSETSCRNASCPGDELAACHVTPCTCDVSFVSEQGDEVDCHDDAAGDAEDSPEGRVGGVDIAEGKSTDGKNRTQEPHAGKGGDVGGSERGELGGDEAEKETTQDGSMSKYSDF